MAHEILVTVSDEAFDAIVTSVKGAGSEEERVTAYLQGQVDAVAQQHVDRAEAAKFYAAGLPAMLATSGLDADQKAFLLADATAKKAASEAEAEALAAIKP